MFGSTYFGPTYFGSTYFGNGVAVEPPPPVGVGLPIADSIRERVYSTPDLISRLPGGFWFGPPDEDADNTPPYGTFIWIAGQNIHDTCGIAGRRDFYQVSLIGPDYTELEEIANLWHFIHFKPRMAPLLIRDRVFSALYNNNLSADIGTNPSSPFATNTVVFRWEMEILTGFIRGT